MWNLHLEADDMNLKVVKALISKSETGRSRAAKTKQILERNDGNIWSSQIRTICFVVQKEECTGETWTSRGDSRAQWWEEVSHDEEMSQSAR